jgi:hypothetical protein
MAIGFSEVMERIACPTSIEGEELDLLFNEIRRDWLDSLGRHDERELTLSVLMREVGKRYPVDDPRNPDYSVPAV